MLARVFLSLWVLLSVFSPIAAHAEVPCDYYPGAVVGAQANHSADIAAIKNRGTVVLKAGTLLQTDGAGHHWKLGRILCLAVDVVAVYDKSKVDANGFIHEMYMADCTNWTKPVMPIYVGYRDDEDWIRAFIAMATDIEDLMGPCSGSVTWQYLPDGRVIAFEPVVQTDCTCADSAYVPPNRSGELALDDLFVQRLGQSPLEETLKMARQVLVNAHQTTTAAIAVTTTSSATTSSTSATVSTDAEVVRAGAAEQPLTPAEFVSRVLSLWRDNDKTGLADRINNSRWATEGIVTWYHKGDCEEAVGFTFGAGAAGFMFGTSHGVIGADAWLGIQQNGWRLHLGVLGGADLIGGSWGIMPHFGPQFRFLSRRTSLWGGADVIGLFGADWTAMGAVATFSLDYDITRSVGFHIKLFAGGAAGISGCNSGTVIGATIGFRWKDPRANRY